ncbi:hypothetical protein GGI25_004157 [Coemansia spiralis]|uniref:peptidylprolyl isomerase n=2 Tax=Coemansia TaxID=4863 RepID=A0A9W8KXF3_9FUNG|nr:hypothetical protein BX070DRAFT_230707 [Coemansia spiralis]KAJ1985905.1 hypothetical protein EDC05_006480 [Coemansia umbellata]KAJ2620480.1 hypothetical protein GGI26_004968 [Coemansia sp. RSA 1358]KAJ2675009.1 hypothetical protein GGI25_004157 [Coemansia spiralis]
MKFLSLSLVFSAALGALAADTTTAKTPPTQLQIGVKYRPTDCNLRTKPGDKVAVHYTGRLFSDNTQFDSSHDRGVPLEFVLGQGQVIKGWDQGLLNMCIGEKRKLKIPADLGYGKRGAPPAIPADAALVFDAELVAINGVKEEGHEEL